MSAFVDSILMPSCFASASWNEGPDWSGSGSALGGAGPVRTGNHSSTKSIVPAIPVWSTNGRLVSVAGSERREEFQRDVASRDPLIGGLLRRQREDASAHHRKSAPPIFHANAM